MALVQIVWRIAAFGKEEARFEATSAQPRAQRLDIYTGFRGINRIGKNAVLLAE